MVPLNLISQKLFLYKELRLAKYTDPANLPVRSPGAENNEVRVCQSVAAYLAGLDHLPRHEGDGARLWQMTDIAHAPQI